MSDSVGTVGTIGAAFGIAIAGFALIGLIAVVRDPANRLLALGWVYIGMSIAAACTAVFVISRLGDRLPIVAGVPVIAILVIVAFGLQLGARRAFRQFGSFKAEK